MIHYDTRKIKINDTFLAIGKGQNYISKELIKKTSKIIKLEKKSAHNYLKTLWNIDTSKIKIIGVTGTNGKTTVTYLLKKILDQTNKKSQVIGTINSSLTTPEMFDIMSIIKKMISNKEEYLIMEVSSIGIEEDRITGLDFAVKCLTNITRDHLDYHKTFKNYVDSKMKFLELPGPTIYPKDSRKIILDFKYKLKGNFNHHNMQAAYAIALKLGISKEAIETALSKADAPKGRFQHIKSNAPFEVFIDYAHTPDGLDNILKEAAALKKNKLITVFGAGGDRDRSKRPLMGKIAEKWSDTIIITNDNPRSEDPNKIVEDIKRGIQSNSCLVIQDREQAINEAIKSAKTGDIVVIAGKGHEDYQIIKNKTIHFDDFEIAEKYLNQRF